MDPQFSILEWIECFEECVIGKAWICKLITDYPYISTTTFSIFSDWIVKSWDPSSALGKIESVCPTDLRKIPDSCKNCFKYSPLALTLNELCNDKYWLNGNRIPDYNVDFVRILKSSTFYRYYIRHNYRMSYSEDQILDMLETPSGRADVKEMLWGLLVYNSDRPYFFVTTDSDVFEVKNGCVVEKDFPDNLRDNLGIPAWGKGVRLVQLSFSTSVVKSIEHRAPSLFDAAEGDIVAWFPTKRLDGFGQTVNLSKWGVALREVVIKTVDASLAESIHYIGELTKDHDPIKPHEYVDFAILNLKNPLRI